MLWSALEIESVYPMAIGSQYSIAGHNMVMKICQSKFLGMYFVHRGTVKIDKIAGNADVQRPRA